MDQQTVFNSLKMQGPEAWLAYLHSFEESGRANGLSSQVIFHHAAPLAKHQRSLEWAEVAIRAAELASHGGSDTEREESLLNAMTLRSWFISQMGSRPAHLVLDKEIVIKWAMAALTLSIREVNDKAMSFWENLKRAKESSNSDEMHQVAKDAHQLRWIKHRLNIIKVLADCGELPRDSVFGDWLQLRESLP